MREKNFYLDILKNCYSKFDKKFYQYKKLKNEFSSYNLIDSSSLVVFIDSALGYQSLARNNKTLACSFRSHFVKNKNLCFGWPSKFAKEGPFWTNYYNLNRLNNKLSNLMKMSNSTWRKIYKKYDKDLLIYNSGNELFKDCLRKLN